MTTKEASQRRYRPATLAVRLGQERSQFGEHAEPIFTSSSFVYQSAEEAEQCFGGERSGFVYSRFTNPTVSVFQDRLAAMEQGEACIATASGMSALLAICLTALRSGDHIVAADSLFGASKSLLTGVMANFGVSTTFVDLTDLDAWRSALQTDTRMVFFETPSNPLMQIADIAAIAQLTHDFNPDIKVVVDNCFCTPVLQQPLLLGADVVLHSATKAIDGQGRCVGGAIVGDTDFVGEQVFQFMRTAGPALSAFNAWVFAKGLETLQIRMQKACENAQVLAEYLVQQPWVKEVHFPGLESHPQYSLAKSQQSLPGAVVSFEVHGGRSAAWRLINETRLLSITANLGDTRSTITHPYTTTHARWSDEDKHRVGINDSLIRIAVGLEDVEDIKEDLCGQR